MVRAIELTPEAPDFWMTLNSVIPNLGKFDGRYDTGLKYQLMVYSVDPRFLVPWKAISYNNLGLAYEYSGNFWAARANFERAASTDPSLDLAWLNLAIISVKLRDQVGFATAIGRLQSINPVLAKSAASQLQPHLNAAQ
jgi:tetratricopeptide (TPR) repeat protein